MHTHHYQLHDGHVLACVFFSGVASALFLFISFVLVLVLVAVLIARVRTSVDVPS